MYTIQCICNSLVIVYILPFVSPRFIRRFHSCSRYRLEIGVGVAEVDWGRVFVSRIPYRVGQRCYIIGSSSRSLIGRQVGVSTRQSKPFTRQNLVESRGISRHSCTISGVQSRLPTLRLPIGWSAYTIPELLSRGLSHSTSLYLSLNTRRYRLVKLLLLALSLPRSLSTSLPLRRTHHYLVDYRMKNTRKVTRRK